MRDETVVGRAILRPALPLLLALLAAALIATPMASADDPIEFDHFRTRFPLTGKHERITCESCHQGGEFAGTPIRCAICHDGSGRRSVTAKDFDHILSTDECADCHLFRGWLPVRMDHGAVTGSCVSCHDGVTATGKHVQHVTSSDACEACHHTGTWQGARFDHSEITGSCVSCHDGFTAEGKSGDHPQSSDNCEECHSTRTWEGAFFDHSNITAPCSSCHAGDVPMDHPATTQECDACHSTRTWEGATFDHSNITDPCSRCHADDLPGGHFVTTEECDVCHSTQRWPGTSFTHTSPNYPGDHSGPPACQACHTTNSEMIIYPFQNNAPDCAGCHTNDFDDEEHKKIDSPRQNYTASELRDCTGACHVYTSSGGIADSKPGPEHRARDRNWD